ncbi:hypothetical protein ONZ51_g1766 [Trametes cubensis]|uniref:Uncharacterized protein n=1 Tax=Trametes cubensis TaxID=1111947 RepID=A0AAD7XHB4_9APHY|nr:hypothetical protein ONZ51_g1766 [Trametes cubensis]
MFQRPLQVLDIQIDAANASDEGDSAGGFSPQHRRVQPTVKFRDIHKDLLEMVQQCEEEEEAESEDHDPLDEDPDDTLPQFLQSRQQHVLSGKELLPTSIVNLHSPALLDLLSDTPRIIAPAGADPTSSTDPQRDVFEDF